MKVLFIPVSIAIMILLLLATSCGHGKNMQASHPVSKVQKDNATGSSKVETSKKTESTSPQTKSTLALPIDVKDNFANRFPLAKNVSWDKEADSTDAQHPSMNYSVVFVDADKTNWIIYSDKGNVIEERQEIEIDQLPQNIYNAIKEKYPSYKIILATTYKHAHKDGSYAVLLKPVSPDDNNKIEVIFRENATQV